MKGLKDYVFTKTDRPHGDHTSRFRRVLRDWDRLTVLLFLAGYAISSLVRMPITVLRDAAIPPVWVDLLMIELLIGCMLVGFGIVTRFYRPQFVGAVTCLFAIGLQFVIGVLADGFTTGDLFVGALFFSIFATVRRVRQKQRTSNNILRVHNIVDQVAQDLQGEQPAGDMKGK